jgi:hypothetical protein
MRGEILKHWQISSAILFATVLIGGAYFIARDVQDPQVAQASDETELLHAIATRDVDKDGLPDWEESLYGTDSHTTDSFNLGMTDGEAVNRGLIVPKAITDSPLTTKADGSASIDPSLPPPAAEGTLTAMFAQNFFTFFLAAKEANGGADLSEQQMNDVANQTMNMLMSTIKPAADFKSMSDLVIEGSGPEAMKAFAVSAEMVLLKNTNDATTTDINYLKKAIVHGDTTANGHLLSIAKGYRGSAAGIAALPIPKELAADALLLVNTLMRMSQLDVDFTKADTDPIVAILALQQYQTVATALGKAFINIGQDYATSYVSLPSGAPGALFVNMIADIEREQAALKKP